MIQRSLRVHIWHVHAPLILSLILILKCTANDDGSQLESDSVRTSSPAVSASCLSTDGMNSAGSEGESRPSTVCSSSHSSSRAPWYDLDCPLTMAEDMSGCTSVPESSKNNALVLYSPPILGHFHRSARTFHLAGRDFSIKQNWADFGVAAVVWDAAIVLCEYLENETESKCLSLKGKRIIELGAGTGLVGMVASQLKGHLTITDRASTFKPLRDNVKFNFSPSSPSPTQPLSSPPSSSSSLPEPSRASLSSYPSSREDSSLNPPPPLPVVKVLEWGNDLHKFPEPFDIILGADIIYIEDTFDELLQTLLHLSNECTLILLSCRIRYERDNRFLDMMRKRFLVEHVFHDSDRGIEIYSAVKTPILHDERN